MRIIEVFLQQQPTNQQHQDDNQQPVPIAMDRLLSIIG